MSRRKRPRTPTPGHYLGLKNTRDYGRDRDRDRDRDRGGYRGRDDYAYSRRSPRRSPPYRGGRDYSPPPSPYGGGRSRGYRSSRSPPPPPPPPPPYSPPYGSPDRRYTRGSR